MTVATDPYSVPLEDIDMSDPDMHHQGLEHVYFERLRREAPLHHFDSDTYGPFWSLSKYEDIIAIDKNHRDYSSDHTNGGHVLGYEHWFNDEAGLHWPMFLAMDRPKHDVQRKAVSPAVAAGNLKNLEHGIKQSVDEILDSLPDDEPFNWVERVSVELTTRTLATLFAFPMEERRNLTRWSDYAFATPGDGLIASWDERKAVMMEMKDRFEELRKERKNNADGFDLISMIAKPIDGAELSPEEYMGNVILLLVGGNDTTRNSLTASAFAMNRFPEQNKKLRENPELVPSFCSEAIRWHTPLPQMKRTALKDTEIRGQKIREGEKVVMWYISGNRDEDVFENPHDVIIDRPNVRNHMAFGFGLHRCVGNRLAELQLRLAWEGILQRFKSVEMLSPPVRVRSNAINGYSDMQVKVRRH